MNTAFKILQLKARQQVYTLLSGHNLSKLHGEGYDFSQLREYQMGDDIRKINWVTTAKLGKPYIKEFHANRELSVVVCAFMDGNLYFGSGNAKQKKLTEVASILGYAAQQNADLFTGLAYTQEKTYATPPTKQLYHIEQFSKILFETPLLGTVINKQNVIKNLFERVYRPSLIFVLGDFLEEVDLSLLAQKHEVIVIMIREKEEVSPKILGEVILNDPTSNHTIESYFGKRSRQKYLTKLYENDTNNKAHFAQYNIRFITILTEEDAISKLLKLFI